ncbi:MAG: ATP-dependent sacrificial sulfur transferase LarE [Candidatus Hydrogenedentes bacterium]|nr:ATP-dependent sacrificial sulfur transferase LarE [Candidatus Hydrogenedentota bacterium]
MEKEERLQALLGGYGSVAVAYSGGVDSTYLADVAHEVLGERARALIADSPSVPRSELAGAAALARARGWRLDILPTAEFENEDYLRNDAQRCYHCRIELFTRMRAYARQRGIAVLAYGSNADDARDPSRVGAVAARELGVAAPLEEVGLSKEEIRQLSARRGLPTAGKASFACLSTRIPTGQRLDVADLSRVEAAEEALKRLGIHQYRARHHGDLCRIEVGADDFPRLLDAALREEVVAAVHAAGYRHVTLDLAGYGAGSRGAPPG